MGHKLLIKALFWGLIVDFVFRTLLSPSASLLGGSNEASCDTKSPSGRQSRSMKGPGRAESRARANDEKRGAEDTRGKAGSFADDKGLRAGSGEFGSGNYGCSWRQINKSQKKETYKKRKKKEGKKRWKSPLGLTATTSSFSELCGAEQIVLKKAPCALQSLRILQPRENVSVTCTAARGQLVGESGVRFAFLNELLQVACVCQCVFAVPRLVIKPDCFGKEGTFGA